RDAEHPGLLAVVRIQRLRHGLGSPGGLLRDHPGGLLGAVADQQGRDGRMTTTMTDLAAGTTRTARPANRNRRAARVEVLRWVGIVVVAVVFLFPLLWMLLAAFKTSLDITDPTAMFRFTPTIDNFTRVWQVQDFGQFMINSMIVGVAATGLSLVLGVPAAYAMSRHKMHGSAMGVLLARIIPGVSLLVPWYFVFAQLGWVGSFAPLITSQKFVTMPLIIWIITSFFNGVLLVLDDVGPVYDVFCN